MELDTSFLNELVGKKILVKTNYGAGTGAGLPPGNYKGVLMGYDGEFIKLEYDIRKYVEGAGVVSKSTLLLNASCIITIEEFQEKAE
jgi:small nuclear ribonucleoprotein (snRNP)-like protein